VSDTAAWFVGLSQEIGIFLVWCTTKWQVLPQIGCKISVGLGNGSVSGLGEVTQSSGGTTGRGVAIFNTSHDQEFLGNWGRYDASTTWGWNEAHRYGATLASYLARYGVGLPILLPQYPRRTGTTESLAKMMAPRMAVATSLLHLTPRPM